MNKQTIVVLILIFFVLRCNHCSAEDKIPVPIDSVDFSRIQHKKVRRLISLQKKYGIKTFAEIHPVCYNNNDSLYYRTYFKSQIIKQNIDIVWQNLVHQSPTDEFDGRIVTFGLLYSRQNNELVYSNESTDGIEEGQVLFFNLRMLCGIKNVAVALEVTGMDAELKTVEYCYMEHGDTKGTQKFILISTGEGETEIQQITKYRCNSMIRDRRLYTFFHELIVKEFFHTLKIKSEPPGLS